MKGESDCEEAISCH